MWERMWHYDKGNSIRKLIKRGENNLEGKVVHIKMIGWEGFIKWHANLLKTTGQIVIDLQPMMHPLGTYF